MVNIKDVEMFEYKTNLDSFVRIQKLVKGFNVNYKVEMFSITPTFTDGIKARDGWHKQPRLVNRISKNPYHTAIALETELNRLLLKVKDIITITFEDLTEMKISVNDLTV
jgi:hypothetical protein